MLVYKDEVRNRIRDKKKIRNASKDRKETGCWATNKFNRKDQHPWERSFRKFMLPRWKDAVFQDGFTS
jgi:hypothetical protein